MALDHHHHYYSEGANPCYIVKSSSSDSANTILYRERLRRRRREDAAATKKTTTTTSSSSSSCLFPCLMNNDDESPQSQSQSLSQPLHDFPSSMMDNVVIIGAGAVGGFVGCCLIDGANNGGGYAQVKFLLRDPEQINRYCKVGFTVHSTMDRDFRFTIPPRDIRKYFTCDPTCLREANCIFVATKRTSNPDIHRLLCQQQQQTTTTVGQVTNNNNSNCPPPPPPVVVVFLQNGMNIRNDLLKTTCTRSGELLPIHYKVIESIVMMNVDLNKETGIVTIRQSIKDAMLVLHDDDDDDAYYGQQQQQQQQQSTTTTTTTTTRDVCELFDSSLLKVITGSKASSSSSSSYDDFRSLQAAMIQINMINAINALSGVGNSVADTLRQPGYRKVLAYCIDECRAVFAAHKISIQAISIPAAAAGNNTIMMMSNFRLGMMSTFLRVSSWNNIFYYYMPSLFFFLGGMSLSLSSSKNLELLLNHCCKCTSLAQELDRRVRPTEIDYINGVVIQLGKLAGIPTPINAKVVELIKRAEALQMGCPRLSPQRLLMEVGLLAGGGGGYGSADDLDDLRNKLMSFDSLRREEENNSINDDSDDSDDDDGSNSNATGCGRRRRRRSSGDDDDDSNSSSCSGCCSSISIQERVQSTLDNIIDRPSSSFSDSAAESLSFVGWSSPPTSPTPTPKTSSSALLLFAPDSPTCRRRRSSPPPPPPPKSKMDYSHSPNDDDDDDDGDGGGGGFMEIVTSFDRSIRLWN